MKRLTLLALIGGLLVIGCSKKSNAKIHPVSQKQNSTSKATPPADLLNNSLVSETFKNLPERKCLRYNAYEDSSQVTVILTDTCSRRTNILYTTIAGGESLLFDRKYPNGKTLTLMFCYEGEKLIVNGSQITSAKDTVLLDQVAIAKIIHSNFKI